MTAYAFRSDHFDGPLDALLSLIEERKLSVSQVSLAEVCDGYLSYVESLPELPLAETSQFILIASTLLLIKSRTLLPTVELSQEETLSIEELERRLAHYAKIKAAAKGLRAIWGVAPLTLQRRAPSLEQQGRERVAFNPGPLAVPGILAAVKKLISTFPKPETLIEASVAPVLALEEVVHRLGKCGVREPVAGACFLGQKATSMLVRALRAALDERNAPVDGEFDRPVIASLEVQTGHELQRAPVAPIERVA